MQTYISQCSDYTFKYNRTLGRHGWLRLTPAYSVKLVEELLAMDTEAKLILDPFAGTATTGLVSAERGRIAYLYDINPFLIWFGNAKCSQYSETEIETARQWATLIVTKLVVNDKTDYWLPKLHNINRWWSGATLPILAALRNKLVVVCGAPDSSPAANLIWIAFCRLIIETSSAAFNHVSMSFHEEVICFEQQEITHLFLEITEAMLASAHHNLAGQATVMCFDARHQGTATRKYDRVITSPPYPNRISYIRELRPYMYWTQFLTEARQAGDLDWVAIGGTWGVATSRLADWKLSNVELPDSLMETVLAIQKSNGKNAFLMAQYVLKYFNDMYLHFKNLKSCLKEGAKMNYIIGNSSFFGVPVQSDQLYVDILLSLGYQQVGSRIVRKRNSKKELFEYDVFAEFN